MAGELSRAVFLSYASEDAAAAERIAEALRAAGIEVWFDKSVLRGGDAWDRMIHEQIQACTLFMPIISANAHARVEGYFRLEWKLAVDRSHRMAPDQAFLMPVVIDDTRQNDSRIPDRFRELQWTRLPGGETTPAFIDRVRRLLSPPAPDTEARASPSSPPSVAKRHHWTLQIPAVLTIAFIIGFVVLELHFRGTHAPTLALTPDAVASAKSIAVLPLVNESGDASQQYFSDGISEDLITALSQFAGLKVIGRTSAFQFRDSKEDSRSIGAKLGVAHLLEGSVRKSGDMIQVSAELIDTADGSTQWSERYDRPYKDLFALQDEITHAVAGALRAKLLPGDHAASQSEPPPGGSLEAYNAYLQGRFYSFRNTEADQRKAIDYYTQATHLDPHYALAWTRLGAAWTELAAEYLEGAPAQEAYAMAREAVGRALALSHELAATYVGRGYLLLNADLDWRGAEEEFRRALELAPNDAEAKFYFGKALATLGDLERAIELTRQALATEPLRANWYNWLATYLRGLNRLDEAERVIGKAIELQPTAESYHYTLTMIEIQRDHSEAALAAAQREPAGGWQDQTLAFARQIGGDRRAADAALRTLIDKDANDSAYQIAEIYALRNDAKATFEWLDRSWGNRDGGIQFLLYDPFILRYKDDPRFAAFCRKVGLPTPAEVAARKT